MSLDDNWLKNTMCPSGKTRKDNHLNGSSRVVNKIQSMSRPGIKQCTCWQAASHWGQWSRLYWQTVSGCCLRETRNPDDRLSPWNVNMRLKPKPAKLKLCPAFIVAAVGEVLTLHNFLHDVIGVDAGVVHAAGLPLHADLLPSVVGPRRTATGRFNARTRKVKANTGSASFSNLLYSSWSLVKF